MKRQVFVATVGVALASILALHVADAWARARSGGSRGSRSYSAPARPAPTPATPTTPSSPSRSLSQATPPPAQPQRPGFFGGLMGAVAGFALGGLLGSLLFGGLGHGFGIGFLDILLIGAGLLLLWSFLRRRREAQQPAYATAGGSMSSYGTPQESSAGAGRGITVEMPAGHDTSGALERGVGHIRQMDPSFDPVVFAERVRTEFTNVQSVLAVKDADVLRDRLTAEMYAVLKAQCDHLKAGGRTNHVQKIDLGRAEVTEAWQENGQDFVTVYFAGSVIDYTVEDRTGQVVEGSKTDPQPIEEFWTFTRPVGPNRWKLAAVQVA